MPAQRTPTAIPADQRSAFANIAGIPWWSAVLLAVTMTLLGFAIEAGSGHKELGAIFATCYVLGCLAAALLVRHSGIFTAVIQPPLLLFVAVPLSYFLLHGSAFAGLKDILITCGYPLIERFPLMLFTTAGALLIGLVRWYLVTGQPQAAPAATEEAAPRGPGILAGLSAKLSAAFARPQATDTRRRAERPRHGRNAGAGQRTRSADRPQRSRDPRQAPGRSRSARPQRAADLGYGAPDYAPPNYDAPNYDAPNYRGRDYGTDYGPDYGAPPPRRRPVRDSAPASDRRRERPAREYGQRTPPPPRRETRREYREPRDPYPPRPRRGESYDPPPPQYRPAPPPAQHPVSRVRYRGEPGQDRRDR